MKTLIKWFVKRYMTADAIKEYVHAANAALKERVALSDGKAKVVAVGNDAAELTAAYLAAFADDGKITDETELAAVNAACDAAIDKYVTDALVDGVLDRVFG